MYIFFAFFVFNDHLGQDCHIDQSHHTHIDCFVLHKLAFPPIFLLGRHQTTGAVIARCGQPEVSWWGWRNADDEHLVQSIAKACAVDSSSRKHLSNGNYTNGSDLTDSDFGETPTLTTHLKADSKYFSPHLSRLLTCIK